MRFNWSGYEWKDREEWGRVHPEKSWKWNDPDMVEVNDGNLLLKTGRSASTVYQNGKVFHPKVGFGLVWCQEEFWHGYFEIEAKLPKGKNLWPAFWTYSTEGWPPEIDVLEGYSDLFPNYFKPRLLRPLGFWNVQTNVHYKSESGNEMIGGKTHWFGFKDPTKNFIKYRMEWRKDSIKFFYNGRMVREVTDKEVLSDMNKSPQRVIINNSLTDKVSRLQPTKSEFIVKSFKYGKL